MRCIATAPRGPWEGLRTRGTRSTRSTRSTRRGCGTLAFSGFSGKVREMGLSPDPERRRAQLANLRKGWEINGSKVASGEAPTARKRDPEPEPAPPAAELEVVPYDPEPPEAPEPEPARAGGDREPTPAAAPESAPEPRRDPDPPAEPERRGGALSELLGGFFGN